mmetsp:Transcript_25759/g.77343  ORF Transcript_25759/g.77343 Transcript_25759/m.77343 type:complete len:145 (+) Transcript_25759:205-639(+)
MDTLRALDGALAHVRKTEDAAGARALALRIAHDLLGASDDGRALLDAAVAVLDTRTITEVVAQPSGRAFVAVDAPAGAVGMRHVAVWPDFSSHPTFLAAAAESSAAVLDKYQLAARLAPLLGKLERREVRDAEYHAHLSCRYAL